MKCAPSYSKDITICPQMHKDLIAESIQPLKWIGMEVWYGHRN